MPPKPDARHAGLRALLIDDDKNIRTTLQVCLEGIGCKVTAVGSADAALEAVEREAFDLAFLDLRLGERSGIDVLPGLLSIRPRLAVVVITAYATFETAVEAIKRGAVDYLPKPFTPAQILHAVDEVAARRSMALRLAELETKLFQEVPEVDFTSESPRMKATLDTIARAAMSDAPVLLRGESGTGKGVLARALHTQSQRSSAPFVTVNCPTLSDDLLASELFGHARGAFTGAVRDQPGRVEAAEGGSLFLDEIGEVSPGIQAKLLRFLQERAFERVGETRTRHANVRLIAATNRNLEQDVASGRFSRGPAVPHQRGRNHRAAAARAPRGHPTHGRSIPGVLRPRRRAPAHGALGRCPRRAARARLARQRPRAAQRHRTRRDSLAGPGGDPRGAARADRNA
jgi:NtrC-family two-component system response regulator AlgB